MEQSVFHVRMLGGFSLEWKGQEITDADNRMRKVWLLLAYLLYRRSVVSPEEVTALLWDGDEDLDNPAGALKTMFYRVRTLLSRFGEDAGQTLILRQGRGYIWNPDIPTTLDVTEFDELCKRIHTVEDKKERLSLQRELLALYRGDFLPKLSSSVWAMPIAAYYQRVYLETVDEALVQLEEDEVWEDVAALSAAALKIEPYNEALYCHRIRAQIARGDQAGAIASYEYMSELLFSHFGVMPSDESRALYRLAMRSGNCDATHISNALALLREAEPPAGALFCEYDFFRILYQAQARAIIRSGDTIHIALLTVGGRRGAKLARRSLDTAVENLKGVLLQNLRQGDIVSQLSSSQLIVMLPQANYENSCMVCDRLLRAFFRQYPHSPADIHFSVQPLEPAGQTRD